MGEKLLCSGCGEPFTLDDADFEFYRRLEVPAPRNCPQCRLLRRLAERNTRRLYYRQCSKTGKRILSQYHHEQPFPVYAAEDWWGDSWDALDYGVQYDYSRSFFEQFLELKNRVPHMALYITGGTTENSDYTNCTGYLKNCYLVSQADYDEDCYYCDLIKECKS
ncbi:MAG TPA: hypothetical protein PLP17_08695, partial [Oligoflexia bacterium]|nr:hypothetical protein [Oligoflexia bacterium]